MLLDQNVEFGSEVSPSTHAVNFTGEQRRDLNGAWAERARYDTSRRAVARVRCVSPHLFLGPVRHQRVLPLWVDVN